MILIASILMWFGGALGVLGILGGLFLTACFAHDAIRRRRARYARGYELPDLPRTRHPEPVERADPQAKPAPRFTHKPTLNPKLPTLNFRHD